MTRFTLGTFSKQYINHEFLHYDAIGTLKRNKKKLKPGKKLVKCTSNCLLTQRNKKLKGTKQEPKSKSLDSPNWDKLTDWEK